VENIDIVKVAHIALDALPENIQINLANTTVKRVGMGCIRTNTRQQVAKPA
jgi:hypothetical protein